ETTGRPAGASAIDPGPRGVAAPGSSHENAGAGGAGAATGDVAPGADEAAASFDAVECPARKSSGSQLPAAGGGGGIGFSPCSGDQLFPGPIRPSMLSGTMAPPTGSTGARLPVDGSSPRSSSPKIESMLSRRPWLRASPSSAKSP